MSTAREHQASSPDVGRGAADAFALEIRGMRLLPLLEIVEAMYAHNTLEWERLRGTEGAMEWLVAELESPSGDAYMGAMHELAARAATARAALVEVLTEALDRGDAEAFAEAAAFWRWLPASFRDFIRAWNGVDVAGFDPAREDIEVWEFTETAHRLRVVAALRGEGSEVPR